MYQRMKGFHFVVILLLMSFQASAQSVVVGIRYFNQVMGNIHQNPSRNSQTMTTVSCNHPIKIIANDKIDKKENILVSPKETWLSVQVGPYEGFVLANYLSDKKVECFEEKYPKFFEATNLDITEHYYWARLYDHYIDGKSRLAE